MCFFSSCGRHQARVSAPRIASGLRFCTYQVDPSLPGNHFFLPTLTDLLVRDAPDCFSHIFNLQVVPIMVHATSAGKRMEMVKKQKARSSKDKLDAFFNSVNNSLERINTDLM